MAASHMAIALAQWQSDGHKQQLRSIKEDEDRSAALAARELTRKIFDPNYREVASTLRPLPNPFLDQSSTNQNDELNQIAGAIQRQQA